MQIDEVFTIAIWLGCLAENDNCTPRRPSSAATMKFYARGRSD
jgi:hypothetical protein